MTNLGVSALVFLIGALVITLSSCQRSPATDDSHEDRAEKRRGDARKAEMVALPEWSRHIFVVDELLEDRREYKFFELRSMCNPSLIATPKSQWSFPNPVSIHILPSRGDSLRLDHVGAIHEGVFLSGPEAGHEVLILSGRLAKSEPYMAVLLMTADGVSLIEEICGEEWRVGDGLTYELGGTNLTLSGMDWSRFGDLLASRAVLGTVGMSLELK